MIRVHIAEMRSAMVVALLVGIIPSVASMQISTPAAQDPPPAEQADATSIDPASEPTVTDTEEATKPPTPQRSGLSPSDNVELQRLFNELRRELLNDEWETVHWWLNVMGIVFTFFGIVVAIAGFLGYRRFREIEHEAGQSVKTATKHAETTATHAEAAKHYLQQTKHSRDRSRDILQTLNTQITPADAEEVNREAGIAGTDPKASPIDKAVARATSLQKEGKADAAVEEWRAIAHVMEGSDDNLAARGWFNVGNLISNKPEESTLAYDNSIRLRPTSFEAYNNRGVDKFELERYDAAILDFDEAIRLKPDQSEPFNNRGNAKQQLGRHVDAVADHDVAIRLTPDNATPHYNRGIANLTLGHRGEARSDFNRALQLAQESGAANVAEKAKQKLRETDAEGPS